MLAFGSPLFLVYIFPFDSLFSFQMKSRRKSIETTQGASDWTVFQRNAFQPVVPTTLFLFLCFCQDEVQIKMHNTI